MGKGIKNLFVFLAQEPSKSLIKKNISSIKKRKIRKF
jgi:hypothetical protein